MTLSACSRCTLDRLDLKRAVYKAESLRKLGLSTSVMLEEIERIKTRIDTCDHNVRELKPIPQPMQKAQPKPRRVKTPRPLPSEAEIQAAIDAATQKPLARTTTPLRKRKSSRASATGHCHDCDRPVTGERRYCGPCLATH